MMDEEFDIENIRKRMNGALEAVKIDFQSLRTGRASSSILDNISVEVYGSKMPISQCATINVPEPRLITINVWDKDNITAIEKSIQNSGLGINPVTEGSLLRLPLPELNEERRKELSKLAAQFAEQARISVRNVRKDGMDKIKKFKSNGMSEDDEKFWSEEVQNLTDNFTKQIDEILKVKQEDILKV
tara:strand:- start:89 stop:649 length:561 start_codon:yes stop_codon:yes gene_type:complete